jgi:hypothetical protein
LCTQGLEILIPVLDCPFLGHACADLFSLVLHFLGIGPHAELSENPELYVFFLKFENQPRGNFIGEKTPTAVFKQVDFFFDQI